MGNNDLDFYNFLNENGKLPDIITSRRFSLHDAAGLKEQLMDLSTTEEAGAIYESYLESFTNTDGTVNWLPMCGEVDGLVANKSLFDKYNLPLPTDYDSFVFACQEFEKVGIRGLAADFVYDYTCMEVLQGLSIPEITSMEGRIWRSRYEDPLDMEVLCLDDKIWPGAFERMEQFISDVNIQPEDITLSYDPVINMFTEGKAAVIRAGGSNTVAFQNMGIDAVFLPYFGRNGEQWLLTYPAFQVALNKDLEKDKTRQEKALQVLGVMLSEEGQNTLAQGEDVITYSQNVNLQLSPYLGNLKPIIDQNQFKILGALSNDYSDVFMVEPLHDTTFTMKVRGEMIYTEKRVIRSYTEAWQNFAEQYILPEDVKEVLHAVAAENLCAEMKDMSEYFKEFRVKVNDEVHYCQVKFVRIDGDYDQFIVGFRSIDEQVRFEQERQKVLQDALASAQHANRAKTTFLNNISHDIRTPMNAIIGFTSLAAARVDNPELVRDYLAKTQTASRHLMSLINDVLDMSRIESGKVKIEEAEVNLPDLIHDLRTIIQADINSKQLELFIDTVDIINEDVICDKLRLNQILLNLLSNAMKFTKPGGMVSLRIIQNKDSVRGYAGYEFRVKDTGIGMSKEFQEHIFEAFTRERSTTASGIQGTGLGMAITKSIVDIMGGTIRVNSEVVRRIRRIIGESKPIIILTAYDWSSIEEEAREAYVLNSIFRGSEHSHGHRTAIH